MSFQLPEEYPYVVFPVFIMFVTHVGLGLRTVYYRKKFNVPIPQVYTVENNTEFNRVQRGHMNYVENVLFAVAATLLSGLFMPRLAAVLGTFWPIGKVIYARGYQVKREKRFLGGILYMPSEWIMWGVALYGSAMYLWNRPVGF